MLCRKSVQGSREKKPIFSHTMIVMNDDVMIFGRTRICSVWNICVWCRGRSGKGLWWGEGATTAATDEVLCASPHEFLADA